MVNRYVLLVCLLPVRRFEDFQHFFEHPLAFGGVFALDGGDDAGFQMGVQDLGANFVESRLHSLNLADDVYAVGIFSDHADDAAQMAFGRLSGSSCFMAASTPPKGDGVNITDLV